MGYDDGRFLHEVEQDLNVKPHAPTRKGSIKATDYKGEAHRRARRRKRTLGYQLSERKRRLVLKPFGWLKEIAGLRRTRFVGRWKTKLFAQVSAAAYTLLRLTRIRLEASPAGANAARKGRRPPIRALRVDRAEFGSPSSGAPERSQLNPPASRTPGLSNFSGLLVSLDN